jgi:hypothetical protein
MEKLDEANDVKVTLFLAIPGTPCWLLVQLILVLDSHCG